MVFKYNYPDYQVIYSATTAVILVCAPIPGFFIAARYTDSKEATNPKIRPLIVAITLLIAVVFFPVMYYCGMFWLSVVSMFFDYTIGEIYLPIGFVIALNVTTPRIRALQTGIILFFSTIFASIAVLILGHVESAYGGAGLTLGLTLVTTIGYFLAGLLFLYGTVVYPNDLIVDSDEPFTRSALYQPVNAIEMNYENQKVTA